MDVTNLQAEGLSTATIVGAADDGRPLVRLPDEERAVAAEALWTRDVTDWSTCRGLRALVGRIDGEAHRPVVLGLLDAPPSAASDALVSGAAASSGDTPRVLHLRGEREVVLECGAAKISLRADGRIVIRGGNLVSRSSGPNKIRGASVSIN